MIDEYVLNTDENMDIQEKHHVPIIEDENPSIVEIAKSVCSLHIK